MELKRQPPQIRQQDEILTLIKTVDGTGSGLDADTLDGQEGSYYTNDANLTATLPAIDGSNHRY